MTFFNLSAVDLPVEIQPQFILDVEKEELHINAGLQDRVVQVLILYFVHLKMDNSIRQLFMKIYIAK